MKKYVQFKGATTAFSKDITEVMLAGSIKKGNQEGAAANRDRARLPPFEIYPPYHVDPHFVPGLANPTIIANRQDGVRPLIVLGYAESPRGVL